MIIPPRCVAFATPPTSDNDVTSAIAARIATHTFAGTQNTIIRMGRSGKYNA